VADDERDIEGDDEVASDDEAASDDDDRTGRERFILRGIIVTALLAGAGYIGFLYHRTPPGEACSSNWHCKVPDGYGAVQCRTVAGRGSVCVLGCTKDDPKSCPNGFACDQLTWEDSGPQTGWFCLPSLAVP